MLGVAFFLSCFVCASLGADPQVPKSFPDTFYTWMITSVLKIGEAKPHYIKGQLLAFDGNKQFACRFDQQNLTNPGPTRPSNFCDGQMADKYFLNNTNTAGNPACTANMTLNETLTKPTLPAEFVAGAKFMSVDKVAGQNCNHFYMTGVPINGKPYQMDAWFTVAAGLPCQVSLINLDGPQMSTTYAFDGFATVFPNPIPPPCFLPKIQCAQQDWVCNVRQDADPGAIGSALGWVCGQQDCSPINPGGKHYQPNTLVDHANWAFTEYFRTWKVQQGYGACNFGGVAELVPPKSARNVVHGYKRANHQQGSSAWANLDLIC